MESAGECFFSLLNTTPEASLISFMWTNCECNQTECTLQTVDSFISRRSFHRPTSFTCKRLAWIFNLVQAFPASPVRIIPPVNFSWSTPPPPTAISQCHRDNKLSWFARQGGLVYLFGDKGKQLFKATSEESSREKQKILNLSLNTTKINKL